MFNSNLPIFLTIFLLVANFTALGHLDATHELVSRSLDSPYRLTVHQKRATSPRTIVSCQGVSGPFDFNNCLKCVNFFPSTSEPLGPPSSSALAGHRYKIPKFCLDWCISARFSLTVQSGYWDRNEPLIRSGVRELLCACGVSRMPAHLVLKLIDLIIVPNRSALLVRGNLSTLTSGSTIPFFGRLTRFFDKGKPADTLPNFTIFCRLTATELREMVTVFISTNFACKSSLPRTVSFLDDFHQVLSIWV